MQNSTTAEFESLKKTVEELKLKQMSDQRELERLTAEFDNIKKEIKETYGVEIEDFEKAISVLEKDAEEKLAQLKESIKSCQEDFNKM